MKRSVFILCSCISFLVTSYAVAQDDQRGFSLHSFHVSPGHNGFLTVEGARVPDGLSVRAGGMLIYANQPLVVRSCEEVDGSECTKWSDFGEALVEHQLILEVLGAVSFFGLFEVGAAIPVYLYQGSDDIDVPGGADQIEQADGSFGLEDLRLHLKLDLLHGLFNAENERFGLALLTVATFPVGNAINDNAFMGDSMVTVHPKLAFDAQLGRVRLGMESGFLWREEKEFYYSNMGSRLTYGVAAEIEITRKLDGIVEVFGQSGISSDMTESPLESDVAARYGFDNGLALTAGLGAGLIGGVGTPAVRAFAGLMWSPVVETDKDGDRVLDKNDKCPNEPEDRDEHEDSDGCPDPDNDGDGIPDVSDKCPNEAEDKDEFEDEDGCPEADNDGDGILDAQDKCPNVPEDKDNFEDGDGCPEEDNDNDGILDKDDKCPNLAEDKDQFEDEDGCPDNDNDGDRIVDSADKCPNEKETLNGVDDEDGCPDEGKVIVEITDKRIDLKQKIHFKTNSDEIVKKQSFETLDIVASVMKQAPKIKLRIEGHTDSRGARDHNMDLSKRRAESVKRYLVEKGIAEQRMSAAGFGPDKPIESNEKETGRAANRRVEFHIEE